MASIPVKVLHIIKTAVGAAWAYHQIRVLQALGMDVVVALPSATEGFAPRYREAGANVVPINLDFPAKRAWKIPSVLRSCRQLVEQVQPDLIHTHHVGTTLVARLALGKHSSVPRVFQVAGPLHLESDFFAALDIRAAGPHDHWFATSEWIRRKYLELGIDPDRVFLSYLGEDVRPFAAAMSAPKGTLRDLLGISRDIPLVAMIAYVYSPKWILGQDRGLKGHEDFMAALNLARQQLPDLRGVVIGGPWGDARWYEDRLRERARATCNGSLAFLGTRRDIPQLLPDIDLVIVPSHSENCGPAIEPLLGGVPVVASNVGGIPDLVRDGDTGWLVPPRNPAALARTLIEAFSDRAEMRRRGLRGQYLARQLFDVERTAREVARAYNVILQRFGRGQVAQQSSGDIRAHAEHAH